MPPQPLPQLDPAASIGVVSLSVADLARSLNFYQHSLGLRILDQAATSATLGVDTALLRLHAQPGARLVRRATGLYHFALRVPTRRDLAQVIRHFASARVSIDGVADHLVSEALYLSDPDGHGIEIYRDRPRDTWYSADGQLRMSTEPLDIQSILSELDAADTPWSGLPSGTDMGHIHLQVANIAAAEQFYLGVLGFARMAHMPSASFISVNGYHHHIGMNTWASAGAAAPPPSAARLLSYELRVSSPAALEHVIARIRAAALPLDQNEHGYSVLDPAHNRVLLQAG